MSNEGRLRAQRDALKADIERLQKQNDDLATIARQSGCLRLDAEAERDRLAEALRPFAKITLSTLYGDNDNEGYEAVLSTTIVGQGPDFTRKDIERARAALAGQPAAPENGQLLKAAKALVADISADPGWQEYDALVAAIAAAEQAARADKQGGDDG